MNTPEASIIIPVYNRIEDVRNLLDQLARQSRLDFEVIVVDDCSDEPVANTITPAAFPWSLRLLRHAQNGGVGKARNTGVSNARGEVLIFVDSDADVADRDWYDRFMTLYQQAGDMARQAGKQEYAFHSEVRGIHTTLLGRVDTYSNWFGSCMTAPCEVRDRHLPMNNTAVRRDVFDRVGYFSEALHLGEDIEWCFRCLDRGVALLFIPGAPIGHFDRNTLSGVWGHYYHIGEYASVIRALRPESPYVWLFPKSRPAAVLLFLPLTLLKTIYIVNCWIRREPAVLFFMPGIYMTNVAYFAGMYKSLGKSR